VNNTNPNGGESSVGGCYADPFTCGIGGGGGGAYAEGDEDDSGSGPDTNYPQCNPQGRSLPEAKLDFITTNYSAALTEATSIKGQIGSISNVDTGALATMFLQWSLWESGYANAEHLAEHNFFGEQQGFQGSVGCPSNDIIPFNSKNACMPSGMSWGDELANALNATSSKTHKTYLQALEDSLLFTSNKPSDALQSIATNGWNGSSTYGAAITNGVQIQSLIDCAVANKLIK
jgi:hypothetical protein